MKNPRLLYDNIKTVSCELNFVLFFMNVLIFCNAGVTLANLLNIFFDSYSANTQNINCKFTKHLYGNR